MDGSSSHALARQSLSAALFRGGKSLIKTNHPTRPCSRILIRYDLARESSSDTLFQKENVQSSLSLESPHPTCLGKTAHHRQPRFFCEKVKEGESSSSATLFLCEKADEGESSSVTLLLREGRIRRIILVSHASLMRDGQRGRLIVSHVSLARRPKRANHPRQPRFSCEKVEEGESLSAKILLRKGRRGRIILVSHASLV